MRVVILEIASILVVAAGVAAMLASGVIDAHRHRYVWLKLLLLGTASFWIPDVVVHGIAGRSFTAIHAVILTAFLPLSFCCTYVLAVRRYGCSKVPVVFPMVLGAWTLGGVFIVAGATFGGGGFAAPAGVREAWWDVLLSLLPPYTFMMATYDGSLFALLLASIGAFLASYRLERQEVGG